MLIIAQLLTIFLLTVIVHSFLILLLFLCQQPHSESETLDPLKLQLYCITLIPNADDFITAKIS